MTAPQKKEIKNLNEFRIWVKDFARQLQGTELILLSGEMGAGKTEFVKTLGQFFGLKEITSPTYALHQQTLSSDGKIKIDHFDLFRLQDSDDLETSGLWEILQNQDSLVIVEWPSKVEKSQWPLQRRRFEIEIKKISEVRRELLLSSF